jgi:hypothetical protein
MADPPFRLGMRDKASDWTGAGGDPAQSIAALQEGLYAVGLFGPGSSYTRGTFDAATQAAVRRFQWYAGNIAGCLDRTGVHMARQTKALATDGIAGAEMLALLGQFVRFGWSVTGNLVRVDFGKLNRIHANSGFKALIDGEKSVGLCDRSFADVIIGMDRLAIRHGLHVFINQLFRVEGAAVSGAVVTPAGFSAHKLGRAVDLQLGTEERIKVGNPKLSAAMMNAAITEPFGKFREAVKADLACRYGGAFTPKDPPHFDRQLFPAGGGQWKNIFYFNQLHYQQSLIRPDAIPAYAAEA